MKILFVSHNENDNGGAQKCLLDLLKGIKQVNPSSELFILFPRNGTLLTACTPYIDGYKIIKSLWWLTGNDKKRKIPDWFQFLWRTARYSLKAFLYMKSINPDVVVTNTLVIPSGAIASRLLGCKHVWFIHEVPSDAWNLSFVFGDSLTLKLVNKLSRTILVTSQYASGYYKDYIPAGKLDIINQAVEIEDSGIVSVRTDSRYTLVMVGNFDYNKSQLELLEAVNRIVASGKDIFCYLVGASDNDYTQRVKDYIIENNLSKNVTVINFCPNPGLYYRVSDVAVICSRSEAFGRVSIEAQKYNIPVIASDIGANPELISNGVNGYLYSKGNVDDLVDKIEALREPEIRKAMNVTDLIAGKYTCTRFASDFLKLLQD